MSKMKNTDAQSAKIGDTLPNGYRILALCYFKTGSGIVAAIDSRGSEYATWQFHSMDLSTTFWGHYIAGKGSNLDTRKEAYTDFSERVAKLAAETARRPHESIS